MGLAGVYLSVHTPRYCTYDAAFAGKLAHPNFQAVRDGMVAQGRHVAALAPDVIVINSCHLVATFPTVVDGTPRHERSEEHTSELQSRLHLVCRLLLEKKKTRH